MTKQTEKEDIIKVNVSWKQIEGIRRLKPDYEFISAASIVKIVLERFIDDGSMTVRRVQRKRCAGWKMPANTVYVGRPTKYGNPYVMEPKGQFTRERAIDAYRHYIERILVQNPGFLDELKGKDLACWCPLDKPCHADVLLKLLEES